MKRILTIKNVKNAPCNSVVMDNMKLLQDLEKAFYKAEAVGPKVEGTLSQVVDTGIRAMIDRNIAKELCNKYQRELSGLGCP